MTRERRRSSLQGFKDVFEGLWVPPRLRVKAAGNSHAGERANLLEHARSNSYTGGGGGEEPRESTFTENFFDLMYVLPMQNLFPLPIADARGLLLFCTYFATVFNTWLGEAFYNTRFDTDDVPSRVSTVVQMVCVAGMASGLARGLGAGDSTFALSYAALRTMLVLKYCRVALHLPAVRPIALGFIAGFTASIALWVGSALVPAERQITLALAGLALDYATPWLLALTPRFRMVPVHAAHMPERFAGFTCLVLAGSLFSVQMQMPPLGAVNDWALAPIYVSALSVAVPLSFLSLYAAGVGLPAAELGGFTLGRTSAKLRIYGYLYLHMPLALAIMVSSNAAFVGTGAAFGGAAAGGSGKLVLPLPPLSPAARSLMCGAWAVATLMLGAVHALGGAQDSGGASGAEQQRQQQQQQGYGSSDGVAQQRAELVAAKCRVRQRRSKLQRLALRVLSATCLALLPSVLGASSVSVYMTAIACVHMAQVLATAFRKRRFVAKAVRAQRRGSQLFANLAGADGGSPRGGNPISEQWPPPYYRGLAEAPAEGSAASGGSEAAAAAATTTAAAAAAAHGASGK